MLYQQLVPRVGIEPTLLAEPDFESGASTNFTTEALAEFYQNSALLQRGYRPAFASPLGLLHMLSAIDRDIGAC